MALKKKKKKPKSAREQLYMLEILIDSLDLGAQKTDANSRKRDTMVRVGFVDLAPVDIISQERAKVKGGRAKREGNHFPDECVEHQGKTCLFVRTPSDLIRSVRSTPLSVQVYRIPRGENHSSHDDDDDDERVLVCAATAFPPESFCDQVTAARNQIDGSSRPHTVMEIYTLCDKKGATCGSVSIRLRLSCFGSSIIDHLTLRAKSYVFQGFPLDYAKFCCAGLPDDHTSETGMSRTKGGADASLRDNILDSKCTKSYDNKKDHTNASFVLTRPESPPRVSMEQPGFEKLTSAEKLNDRKYRGTIYNTYPDEATCSCPRSSERSMMHPMTCRSGCVRSCCMALRNPEILRDYSDDGRSRATLADSVDDSALAPDAEERSADRRMRGGGRKTHYPLDNDDEVSPDDRLYTWCRDNSITTRAAGGSDKPAYPPSEVATTVIYEKSKEPCVNQSQPEGQPRSHPGTQEVKTADCVYPGKELSSWRTGTKCPKCSRKQCVGADCLIRAFKEAQAFVDSLGKVPGMVGLGLMDPSESPYFGRAADRQAIRETPSERKRGYALGDKPVISNAMPFHAVSPGMTMALPEVVPVPVAIRPRRKEDKKEERAEKQKELDVTVAMSQDIILGPCGEPKCKSRRKVPATDGAVVIPEAAGEPQKVAVLAKPPSTITTKSPNRINEKTRQRRGKLGPEGDREGVASRATPIKISKRVMRYVYTIGDVYPGVHYGHKNCIEPRFRVPANMGWLWNTRTTVGKLKPRIGWKPGAISRYLNELLMGAKGASLVEDSSRSRSVPSRASLRRGKVYKTLSYVSQAKKEGEEEAEPPPTLHIHRKDGTYYVTMYPIKPETADVAQLEEPTKPLQFKIVRNKDDASVATSSTASDMEIEFSPPAAVSRYRRRPDVIHVDTQVKQQEILEAFKVTEDATPRRKERRRRRERRGRK